MVMANRKKKSDILTNSKKNLSHFFIGHIVNVSKDKRAIKNNLFVYISVVFWFIFISNKSNIHL